MELSVQDALKGTGFNEMVSMKSLHELDNVVSELKQCVEFDRGGISPTTAPL